MLLSQGLDTAIDVCVYVGRSDLGLIALVRCVALRCVWWLQEQEGQGAKGEGRREDEKEIQEIGQVQKEGAERIALNTVADVSSGTPDRRHLGFAPLKIACKALRLSICYLRVASLFLPPSGFSFCTRFLPSLGVCVLDFNH